MTWRERNLEGVRLMEAGDHRGARAEFEAAAATAPDSHRGLLLVNAAHAVDLTGDRQGAVDLLTRVASTEVGEARVRALVARADLLPWLGRWDEAWADLEGLLPGGTPELEVLLGTTRVALLMMAGRADEAEEQAVRTLDVALRHDPAFVPQLYTNRAIVAEHLGDERRAAAFRGLAEVPVGEFPARWRAVVECHALEDFEGAYRAITTDDDEAARWRAATLTHLVGADPARWADEAVAAARSVVALPDGGDGAVVLANALIARSRQRLREVRLPAALADVDEALALLPSMSHGVAEVEPFARAARASVLAAGGHFAEASAAANAALDLAYGTSAALAADVHRTLAEIADATGDPAGAAEHLGLAGEFAAGDPAGEAAALVSLARLAYLRSDHDAADAWYDRAEALAAEDPVSLSACLVGRAAVRVTRGEGREALALLDRAVAAYVTPRLLLAEPPLRAAAFESLGEHDAADEWFAIASRRCAEAGMWHVDLGLTWWRVDALVRRAAAVSGAERRVLAQRALDLGLPAALAAEAVRHRFPPGPLRERWVARACAPTVRAAFLAVRAVGDLLLAAEYVDHLAGSVSLGAAVSAVALPLEVVDLPVPPAPEAESLPHAASGLVTGADPAFASAGFALPPRVRVDPATPSTVDHWIDVAERRYGVAVRSGLAVSSW
ncbi:hypothetical protein [Actinosynnema sp. NPDC020468]|uniref:hypothetical protein n=1 Tax=Actinosynnema sp. NPDC020468 TaxID=3154488 RepID=UPI0034041A06